MRNPVARAVNRRAHQRYGTFWNCLLQVDGALGDARKIAARLPDSTGAPFWVASAEDVAKAVRRVERALTVLSRSGKRWEAELISREWRK